MGQILMILILDPPLSKVFTWKVSSEVNLIYLLLRSNIQRSSIIWIRKNGHLIPRAFIAHMSQRTNYSLCIKENILDYYNLHPQLPICLKAHMSIHSPYVSKPICFPSKETQKHDTLDSNSTEIQRIFTPNTKQDPIQSDIDQLEENIIF